MTSSFQRDLIRDIFGERPELAFLGHLGQAGLGRGQEEFLQGRASKFITQLQQAMGQQMVQGGLPTINPDEFFGGLDFRRELNRFSPEQRGMDMGRFAPRTRFQF